VSVPNGHDMASGDADSPAADDSSPADDSQTRDKADTMSVAGKTAESGDEVVVIQDTGFNISIVAPGVDPFDLPVGCSLVAALAVNLVQF